MPWQIGVYEDENGDYPVKEFIAALPENHRGKIIQCLELLEAEGPNLPFPYSSQIEGGLRELRAQYGKAHYRILYYGDVNRVFVLLHAFVKKTAAIPEQERERALQRMRLDQQRKAS